MIEHIMFYDTSVTNLCKLEIYPFRSVLVIGLEILK
jgi:hypothetical protein